MGIDKRTVTLDGETLLERSVRRLRAADLDVTVVGGPPDVPASARHLPDDRPGAGPMGGVLTALAALDSPLAIVAVDMPDVSIDLLELLAARRPELAAVPVANGTLQPLHVVWGPSALRQLEEEWTAGERSLRSFLERNDVDVVDEQAWRPVTASATWWTSLDHPEDVAARQTR